jgi:transposase-like protein
MERRRFTREFKLEAVRLIRDQRGVVGAGIARPEGASDATAQLGEGIGGRSAA